MLVVVAGLLAAARPAEALSTSIVISQVYGGGGNTGATLKRDFIELFNRGSTAVDVTGWSVQYGSATGTTWQKTTLAGTIEPGHYYLIAEAAGAGGTVDLPTPDATGSIAMSATAAKVALRADDVLLTTCPTDSVDLVGYGAANCSETSPAPGLSNTTADLRGEEGCRETDDNSVDFAAGAPNPRNSAAPANACADPAPFVASTDPANNAVEVPTSSNVSITFSEPVSVTGDWFTISCFLSGAHSATVTGGPTTFVLDPDTDFSPGETCTVTVIATQVSDDDSNDPPDTMAANHSFSFSVTSIPARIHEIQGAAHLSPLAELAVDVPGVVVARGSNGFWFQDPDPDANDATSEGLFVFTGSAPAVTVGDALLVSGRVAEFRPGCSPSCPATSGGFDNLTTTEIVAPRITAAGPGAAIAPTVIGDGGRIPPAQVIENDATATGNVETSGVFDPAQDGIDFYESLEGMRVQINDAVAVGPRSGFGEIAVVGDGGAHAGTRTARGGVVIAPTDFNPERVILDDPLRPTPNANVSDRFPVVLGVLDYSFGNFKLLVTETPAVVVGGLAREATVPQGADELALGSFNVENLDPGDPPSKFAELAGLIVNNLRSPDIVGVQEVQDNDGPSNTSETDATTTASMLIAAIVAAGGPTYEYRDIDPVDDQDGGEPGGNIRVGFLFRTDRGLSFVDRPGAGSETANAVDGSGAGTHLRYSPGRIDPTNAAFANSRKPLAAEFTFNGQTLFLIVNHFNSKGGDDPLFGRFQPPVRSSEVQRHQQAAIVNGFVDQLLAANRDAFVVVFGDLNDFEFSETLDILRGGGDLFNLMSQLAKPERYSYVFEGNSQVLDQMLVSPRVRARLRPRYDVVHVNAEFFDQASDHDPSVARLLLR